MQEFVIYLLVAVWLNSNIISEVTLRRAGLVLRSVTVHGYTVITVSVFNQANQANSACPYPSLGIGVMSTGDG